MALTILLILQLLLSASPVAVATKHDDVAPTSIFIDTVSGYTQLSTCAEEALSTIVRAQSSGCGDDGQLTNYTCFCTDSRSMISSVISTAVMTSCGSASASAQASSALSVFDGYCALGLESASNTTSTTPAASSSTAMPAVSATTTGAVQTATAPSTSSTSDSSDNTQRTTAIAVGVVVPVIVIGLALALFLVYRKRARSKHHSTAPIATGPFYPSSEMGTPANETLKNTGSTSSPQEAYGPASELPAARNHVQGVHELVSEEVGYKTDPEAWRRG